MRAGAFAYGKTFPFDRTEPNAILRFSRFIVIMKLRLSSSLVAGSIASLSLLAACSSTETPTPEAGGTAGTGTLGSGGKGGSAGATNAGGTSGGAGTGSAGHSAGGASTGGSAGMGSGGTGNSANTVDPSWDTIKAVLTGTHPPCNGADCHGSGGPNIFQFNINDDAALYTALTTHVSVDCGNIPVVTPGDPSKSALVKVLNGPCSAKVPQMPNGCTPADGNCLPPEYIAAVTTWITNGAPH
jgi:hypothetical protein